jgi:hypothetical protein
MILTNAELLYILSSIIQGKNIEREEYKENIITPLRNFISQYSQDYIVGLRDEEIDGYKRYYVENVFTGEELIKLDEPKGDSVTVELFPSLSKYLYINRRTDSPYVICGSLLNPDDYQKLNILVDSPVIPTLKHAYFADAETKMTKKFNIETSKFVDFLDITYTIEMKISPDDEFVAIETSDVKTKVYSVKDGKVTTEFPNRMGIIDINSRYLLYQKGLHNPGLHNPGLYDHKLMKELKIPDYYPRFLIGENLIFYVSYEGSSHGAIKISHKLFNINNANLIDVNIISFANFTNRFSDGVIINLDDKAIIIKNDMEIRTIDLPKPYIDLGILG